MKSNYQNLELSQQLLLCRQFKKLYPQKSNNEIHEVFQELNPVVDFNDRAGEFDVWEAWKSKFERMIA